EIVSGLNDGDVVVIEKRVVEGNATTSNMSGMMGGGFGGGMPASGMGGNRGGMPGGMPGGMRY
ncbi:MAG: efflux RND transporter periplasmic adaptor subunit, partial [Clostridia bacterium]|nr:efflux RND transporter periplasmic adaptor subunit [Clostridia bacterium]